MRQPCVHAQVSYPAGTPPVGVDDGVQAVRDSEARHVPEVQPQRALDVGVCVHVHAGGGLVQHQQPGPGGVG